MDDRNWVQQQQFYAAASNPPPHAHPAHGHRMLNMQEQKSLEEQIEYPPREMLNQMQEIALARSLNQVIFFKFPSLGNLYPFLGGEISFPREKNSLSAPKF